MIICSVCSRTYQWRPELAGKSVRCKCGAKLLVPQQDDALPPAEKASPARVSPPVASESPQMDSRLRPWTWLACGLALIILGTAAVSAIYLNTSRVQLPQDQGDYFHQQEFQQAIAAYGYAVYLSYAGAGVAVVAGMAHLAGGIIVKNSRHIKTIASGLLRDFIWHIVPLSATGCALLVMMLAQGIRLAKQEAWAQQVLAAQILRADDERQIELANQKRDEELKNAARDVLKNIDKQLSNYNLLTDNEKYQRLETIRSLVFGPHEPAVGTEVVRLFRQFLDKHSDELATNRQLAGSISIMYNMMDGSPNDTFFIKWRQNHPQDVNYGGDHSNDAVNH